MGRTPFTVFALAALASSCVGDAPTSRYRAPAPAGAPPPAAPVLQLAEQARELSVTSRPGPSHAALDPLVGDWDVELATVSPTGGESEPFRGHATLAWTLGRRFLRWDATVEFGAVTGTTTGFLGFDERNRQYQLMMISDLATGMEIARGGGELRGAGLTFDLERVDPATGARLLARSRLRSIKADHFVLEQLETGLDGKERASRVWHYRKVAPTR